MQSVTRGLIEQYDGMHATLYLVILNGLFKAHRSPFGLKTTLFNSARSKRAKASLYLSSKAGMTRSMNPIFSTAALFRISACSASWKIYRAGQRPN